MVVILFASFFDTHFKASFLSIVFSDVGLHSEMKVNKLFSSLFLPSFWSSSFSSFSISEWWPARDLVSKALESRFEVDPSGRIIVLETGNNEVHSRV